MGDSGGTVEPVLGWHEMDSREQKRRLDEIVDWCVMAGASLQSAYLAAADFVLGQGQP